MTTVLAEAFGRLSPHRDRSPDVLGEDLYSIFLARSQLMGWSTINSSASPGEMSSLWDMNEADLIYENDGHRIGFAQVGLDVGSSIAIVDRHEQQSSSRVDLSDGSAAPFPTLPTDSPTDPVLAIPPLIQCLDGSLRWFGEVEVTAVQVTAFDIAPRQRSYLHRLVSVLNWFNLADARERPSALVTVAADPWKERLESEVVDAIQRTNTGSFEVGSLVTAPVEHVAGPEWVGLQWDRTDKGLDVAMPEWSPSTVGWVAARVVEAALDRELAPQHLSVRIART